MKDTLIKDLQAVKLDLPEDSAWFKVWKNVLWAIVFSPKFHCTFLYRINHKLAIKKWPFRRCLNIFRFYLFKNDIAPRAKIGKGLRLVHVFGIVIGVNAKIGDNVTIFNDVTIGGRAINNDEKMPEIGNRVLIGTGARIIGDIKIGDNVIIGANTFCDRDVPSNSVAYGNPMRIKEDQKIEFKEGWKFYLNKN